MSALDHVYDGRKVWSLSGSMTRRERGEPSLGAFSTLLARKNHYLVFLGRPLRGRPSMLCPSFRTWSMPTRQEIVSVRVKLTRRAVYAVQRRYMH